MTIGNCATCLGQAVLPFVEMHYNKFSACTLAHDQGRSSSKSVVSCQLLQWNVVTTTGSSCHFFPTLFSEGASMSHSNRVPFECLFGPIQWLQLISPSKLCLLRNSFCLVLQMSYFYVHFPSYRQQLAQPMSVRASRVAASALLEGLGSFLFFLVFVLPSSLLRCLRTLATHGFVYCGYGEEAAQQFQKLL